MHVTVLLDRDDSLWAGGVSQVITVKLSDIFNSLHNRTAPTEEFLEFSLEL